MAKLVPPDPQSASDYEDRTTRAVKGVLIEIGQILGSFKGKFAVIGGAVPWLLLLRHRSFQASRCRPAFQLPCWTDRSASR